MAIKDLNVVVWSKQGCSYCAEVKQYLNEKGITYKDIDVTDHDDRRDILEVKYGVRHVPVVEIGQENQYEAITEIGVQYIEEALKNR
ncbi:MULTISPECIES: glutaredoxin family protein [Oceanobacillus]|uniref:Glutaredoxin n=1 Tax=Oceanobacillus profundus TaxID=372463 RepID=A0A417YAP1_9BACI|nr:glutaredoxin [Oceanobacillus sp.]PAE27692.1 NrdH-redoxin [Paenibacillus sp. 7884-2]RHW29753.1 glutaredoxin [Oceanobacillus profundus]